MSISRGSATISFAPVAQRLLECSAPMGCASVVLEPMTRMASASSSSAIELVMAPLPSDWARPATVEACQRRAQWSTLLVPSTARMNFWKT